MTIKKWFILSFIGIVSFVIIMFTILFYFDSRIDEELHKFEIANSLNKHISILHSISTEYIIKNNSRNVSQWNYGYRNTMRFIKSNNDYPIAKKVIGELNSMNTFFNLIKKERLSGKQTKKSFFLEDVLVTQIKIRSQNVFNIVSDFNSEARREIAYLKEINRFILMVFSAISLVLLFIIIYFASKKISRPLEKLVNWTDNLSFNDLLDSHIVELSNIENKNPENEITKLSVSYKNMVVRLVESFSELKNEIVIRKETENKLKGSLEEKDVLLKEVHHRVKNNMQVVSSLLSMQSEYVEDEKYKKIFQESQSRVYSMSLVHEKLYKSDDFSRVEFSDFIISLMNDIDSTYGNGFIKVEYDIENDLYLNINQAIPCALIINEICTNIFQHAFDPGQEGTLKINIIKSNENFELVIADNGKGFPENYNYEKSSNLGGTLIIALVRQIKGVLTLDNSHGVEYKIVFPS